MINRADKGSFVNWWFTVDRTALLLILVLAGIGQMLAFAASPAVTGRTGFGDFHYAARQVMYAVAAMAILGGSSLLSLRQVKIVAAITFACALIASFLVLFVGADVLGARRELDLGPLALQPSEFLKPSFAVLAAAVLADRKPLSIPRPLVTLILLAPALAILVCQPDVGQTGLLLCLWGAMLFFWGLPLSWVGIGTSSFRSHLHPSWLPAAGCPVASVAGQRGDQRGGVGAAIQQLTDVRAGAPQRFAHRYGTPSCASSQRFTCW